MCSLDPEKQTGRGGGRSWYTDGSLQTPPLASRTKTGTCSIAVLLPTGQVAFLRVSSLHDKCYRAIAAIDLPLQRFSHPASPRRDMVTPSFSPNKYLVADIHWVPAGRRTWDQTQVTKEKKMCSPPPCPKDSDSLGNNGYISSQLCVQKMSRGQLEISHVGEFTTEMGNHFRPGFCYCCFGFCGVLLDVSMFEVVCQHITI